MTTESSGLGSTTPDSRATATLLDPLGGLRAYLLMVRWELLGLRLLLPVMIAVQVGVGAGSVIGFGFLLEEVSRRQAVYLASGGSVIALLMIGLVAAPQMIAQHKAQKTYDFLLSLPVPRAVIGLAGMTVWMIVALPGMAFALTAAALWYDLGLRPGLTLIPAVLLTVFVSTSVGFAFAHALPHPSLTHLITQLLAFFILMYSPINFPPERLPGWLQALHGVLPFQHAASLVRASLFAEPEHGLGTSFLVLSAWTIVGWAITFRVLARRR